MLSISKQGSWDALICGYVKEGKLHHAISLCRKLWENSAFCPTRKTCIVLLKACSVMQVFDMGITLHGYVAKMCALDQDIFVGSAIVEMYINFGSLEKAQEVFDSLQVVDVVLWTLLIAGYTDHGFGEKAYCCYERMQETLVSPDIMNLACVLRACSSINAANQGMKVNIDVVKRGFEKEPLIGSALVDMYAKCNLLKMASKVFDNLLNKEVASWNALIVGYARHNHSEKALHLFDQMQRKGVSSDNVTFVHSLKACCIMENVEKGREIHTQVIKKGSETDLLVSSTLVSMYARNFLFAEAEAVFDMVAFPNEAMQNSLLSVYLDCKSGKEALSFFETMQHKGRPMSAITFILALKSCSNARDINKGQKLHADIVQKGLEGNLLIGGTTVDIYGKCGLFAEARSVLDRLPCQDAVSWTAMMAGYSDHGKDEEVLDCYEQMQYKHILMNAVSYMCVLKSCGNLRATERGLRLHTNIINRGLDSEVPVSNSLVEMYSKFGWLVTASVMLNTLQAYDSIAFNSLLSGCVEKGDGEGAIICLEWVQPGSIYLNAGTFICSLKACGLTGFLSKGQWLHLEIVKRGFDNELLVENTLIDTYAKLGRVKNAHILFRELFSRSTVSWTALILGYAQLGKSQVVLNVINNMLSNDVMPNLVTCLSVLTAYSHAGLIAEGFLFFKFMICELKLVPNMEHFTCFVDMLGRVGHTGMAISVLLEMPMQPNTVAWQKALGACQTWGHLLHGRHAFRNAMQIDESDTTAYVYMYNIYADAKQ